MNLEVNSYFLEYIYKCIQYILDNVNIICNLRGTCICKGTIILSHTTICSILGQNQEEFYIYERYPVQKGNSKIINNTETIIIIITNQ
ncbi:hypothetical protein PFDG_05291 [Plasmodium falciparum Dd2]|uniref:Uncharacterized protein n=1 Tax=Plasmodium falciparum (isolate Dd2) TaxID=57267 RepID=A0A0L7MAA4_PLAF4|nr:hypothetical protein PFDG_05291 [Plasmodium falciparum Dd2]